MAKRTVPSRAGRWRRRQWLHLLACIAGFLVAAGSTAIVLAPQWTDLGMRHGFGGWICDEMHPITGFVGHAGSTSTTEVMFVLKTASGFQVVDWSAPEDRWAGLLACRSDGIKAYEVTIYEACRHRGDWSLTRRPYETGIDLNEAIGLEESSWNYEPHLEAEELRAIRRLALQSASSRYFWVVRNVTPRLIESGEANGTYWLWSGYLINTATLLGLGMWLWFTPLVIRDVWRCRRARRSGCRNCGYDLSGLPEGASVCPECGSAREIVGA